MEDRFSTIHPALPIGFSQNCQGKFAFCKCTLHKLLQKLELCNKTPKGHLRDSLHTGLHCEMCHTLGEGARRELLTQELPAIPRSALNQQIKGQEKSL